MGPTVRDFLDTAEMSSSPTKPPYGGGQEKLHAASCVAAEVLMPKKHMGVTLWILKAIFLYSQMIGRPLHSMKSHETIIRKSVVAIRSPGGS